MDHMVAGIPQFTDSCMLNRSSSFFYRLNYIMSHIIIHHHKNLKSKL
jgi:hypothetical protein